jgi:two-component system sensor histidine kinase HydH
VPPEPLPELEDMQRAAQRSLLERLVVVRLALAPVMLALQGAIWWYAPDPWRGAFTALVATAMLTVFGVEFWRVRSGRAGPLAAPLNVVAMLWVQLGVVVASGGIHSPFLVLLPVMAGQVTVGFGRSWPAGLVVAAHLGVTWALVFAELSTGWSPAMGGDGAVGLVLVRALVLTVVEVAAVGMAHKVRTMVVTGVGDVVAAHDNERRAHAEHARELVSMTGEIAHELKNPLASIKGLAALLARDLDGRSAERLAVLRTEVDRMQETLDTFLDLSRPLVPLAEVDVELAGLATEVSTLCDGLLRARDLTLRVEGRHTARGDRRKLRQVLVNLVQNAIEAAPAGSEVVVQVVPDGFRVLDRGPGLPPGLAERVFEPGVTTRPRGNGLGLAIARGLVRQHGGELALSDRDGGGTAASVVLPAGVA